VPLISRTRIRRSGDPVPACPLPAYQAAPEIKTRWPFAGEERVAGAVADIGRTRSRVATKYTIFGQMVGTVRTEIVGCGDQAELVGPLRFAGIRITGTSERIDGCAHGQVRQKNRGIQPEIFDGSVPKFSLFKAG
jgi:hypothetical protein